MPEHLRRIRDGRTGLARDVAEVKLRLGNPEAGFASFSGRLSGVEAVLASRSRRLDRVDERLTRIERRLDLGEH